MPVLWISAGPNDETLAGQLKQAGLNVEHQSDEKVAVAAIFDWLSRHAREEFPASIDCETNSPAFARCYWITGRVQASFDAKEREIQIISRAVVEMRVTVPAAWAPATLNWNGVVLEKLEMPGCRLLRMEKELESTTACP